MPSIPCSHSLPTTLAFQDSDYYHFESDTPGFSIFAIVGKKLPEERYYLLTFVSSDIIDVKNDVWFAKLDANQISLLNDHLLGIDRKPIEIVDNKTEFISNLTRYF